MAEIMGTGSLEEELLRQQREAEERARQEQERAAAEAKKAEEEAAAASAESEKAAQEATSQAQQAAQNAAEQGAKVDIGPTNRPFTEEQSFLIHQREAVRNTDTDIVKIGELERLPAELEPHREMLEEKNRKGEIIPSAVNDWGTNRIDINFGSIKDNNQAGYFATTLATDSDKLTFFKEYAARTGQNYYTLLNEAEAKLGSRLFSTPQTQTAKIKAYNQGLSSLNLMDIDGNVLDLNTATQSQIEQAIRILPDVDDHKDAVAYLVKLGEMRGWTIDKDSLDFMDSADLTQKDYNDAVDEYNKLFTIGYTPENEQAYLEELAYIQDQGYKPRVQKQMEAALKKSYEARTGKIAPPADEIRAALSQKEADGGEEDGSTWIDAITGLFKNKGDAKKKEPDPLIAQAEEKEVQGPQQQQATGSTGASSYAAAGSAVSSASPASSYAASAEPEMPKEVQGPDYQAQEIAPEDAGGMGEMQGPVQQEKPEEAKRYTRDIAYDPSMTDEQALAYYMGGGTLDARNREQIAWLTDDAAVRGVVTGLNPNDLDWDTGSVSRYRYDGTQYWQYGPTISNAAQIRDSGILTDDMNLSASLVLGRAVKTLREDAANPEKGISIPTGENMFEYMLSLPQYEGVRNSLASITNAQKDVARISAENEVEAKNAHLADVQNWTEQVKAQTATPETLALLADEYENGEYVNFSDDETYQTFKHQLSERSTYFHDDNGRFWQGDSAAAIEGRNIRTLGGKGASYSDYKWVLKREAMGILEDYTIAAMRMGMTLEDYLGSAGIDSIDQILDIAYNNMQAVGNAYGRDTDAQQAVQTVVDNPESVGIGAAAWTGGRRAVEDRTARLMQASYLMLEQADYQATVKELTNSYFAKYGEEAPRMYYSDLMSAIESGQLSEATAQELLANIQSTPNIFEIGYEIDGGLLESLLRDPAEAIAKDVETLDAVIAKMPERERFTASLVGSAADMLYGMATATAIGAVTGSPFAGSSVAWGLPAVDQKYDELAGTGMTKNTRFYASMAYGGATALANKAGTGGAMDIWGDLSKEAQRKAYMSKGMPGLIKASLKLAAQHGAQEAVEEAGEVGIDYVFDVTQDAVQAYDRGENPKLSRAFQITLGNIYETDVREIGRELLTSAGMGFAMGGIFALAGAARSGYAAQKGVKMERKYGSISLARQIVDGEVELTEESVGKVYAQVQKDLADPGFKRWIDNANATAREQNNMVTAAMMGAGRESRKAAVKEANRAEDYREKAAAAKSAAQTAESRWIELRQQVMNGDLSAVPMMTTAQQQMGKAYTALREAETAASKAETLATEKTRQWLAACGTFKSQAMEFQANRTAAQRYAIAKQLAEKYEAEEASRLEAEERSDAAASREVAYAEDYLFAEEEAADTAIAEADELETMSDEELDGIIVELNAQISEAEARIADVTSRREELGLDGESIQALVDQELTPLSSRKDKIIAREKSRFNNLFDRQMQLIEMENDESADQIQAEYDAVGGRLRGLGVDVDALMMQQYGIDPEEAETAQETAQQAAESEEEDRVTDSLSRQMEATQASLDAINPVRKHLASTPIYINESQAADILSEEGLKNISQFNWRYGTQLTTEARKGAMPLDGHVLTDINDETPGVIDVNADPVAEILRILHAGKELTARQRSEKQEARELKEQQKKKKADAKAAAKEARQERVYELTGEGSKPERQARQINQVIANDNSTTEDIDRAIDRIEGVSMSMAEETQEAQTDENDEGVSSRFSDPVMQKLASDLYKNWGIRLRTADLDPHDEGFYDRESNTIVLNKRLTSGEKQRTVVMHELIHFCEGQAWYPQFRRDILSGAYSGEAEIEENRQRLRDMGYGEDELDFELVAHAAKPLFEGDELLIGNLISNGKVPAVKRAYAAISQYLARRKAKKMGMGKQYNALVSARKTLAEGLKNAKAVGGKETRNMYVGQDADGKGIYESNFPKGTSRVDKQKRLIRLWQNVWSQKPIELNIKESDGTTRAIVANFDPDYDPSNVKMTDLGKVMSNKNGSGGDRNVTLNLADDLYDLARTSVHLMSEDESGKGTATHKDVKRWHYFFNDIIYRGDNGDIPYTVWLDVKEKDDGGYVYQLYAKKTKKDDPATASNAYQNPLAGISQSAGQVGTVPQGLGTNAARTSISNTNIQQNGIGVNSQSMQNGTSHSYSDMALSQYGNKTAQEIDWISQTVKDQLKGSEHEVRTDRAAIMETMQRIEDMGGTNEALRDLMSRPVDRWNAQDHAMAKVLTAKAEYDGDITTAAMVAMIDDKAGSEAGLALQKRKLLSRMNLQNALELAARLSGKHNMKNGGSSQYAPVGSGRPLERTGSDDPAGAIIDRAKRINKTILAERGMDDIVERENRWGVPLTGAQLYLIEHYGLSRTDLPGIHYNQATLKQRMLAAILATDTDVLLDTDMDGNANGLLGLIQQLEAMKDGKAVQTVADLTYIANQMAEMKAQSNGSEDPYMNTEESQRALARAYDAINNVVPVTGSQKASALAYMNMLSASTTGVKNVLGNVVMGPMESISETIAAGIDKMISGKTGNRTTAVSSREEVAEGLKEGLAEAAHTIADTYIYQTDTSQSRRYDVSGDSPRIYQNGLAEGKRRFVDMVMQLGDRPFFRAEYSRQLAMIKRLSEGGKMKKKNVTSTADGRQVVSYSQMTEADMHKEAAQRALERVFQEDNAIVNWVNNAPAYMRPFLQAVIPFVKTPTNIAKRMLDYSPVGLAKTLLINVAHEARRDGGFDQRKFVMGIGRGLTGTGMIMAGALLSGIGALDVEDGYGEEDDSALYGAGMANYDPYGKYLVVGGNKMALDWLGAAGIWLTIGAEAAKAWSDEDMGLGEKMYTTMLKSGPEILNLIFDNTMLSSASNLLSGAENGETLGENIVKTIGGSMLQQYFSPADIRQFAKFTDAYERDYRHDNPLIELINKNVIRYWPVLRQMLPVKYDMTGDAVRQSSKYGWGREDENAVLNFMNMYMSPTNIQSDKGDRALDEVIDLSYRRGDTACIPKNLITTSGKVTVPAAMAKKARMDTASGENKLVLTADETRRYNQMYASLCFNGTEKGMRYEKVGVGSYGTMKGIRDLIDSSSYERMDDQEREEAILETMKIAKEMTLAQIVIDRGYGR